MLSGLLSLGLGLIQGQSSARAARSQQAFQERMSSTAHQREVADLRKAGLNPILSARGSGASTPVGTKADSLADLTSNAKTASLMKNVEQVTKTEKEKTREQKGKADSAEYQGYKDRLKMEGLKKVEEKIRDKVRTNSAKKANQIKYENEQKQMYKDEMKYKDKSRFYKERYEQRKRRNRLFGR